MSTKSILQKILEGMLRSEETTQHAQEIIETNEQFQSTEPEEALIGRHSVTNDRTWQ